MGRIARVVVPGVWHHITQRGNRREAVFFNEANRTLYLQLLRKHCARYGVKVTGYCLMTNHVHVLAVPPRETALARALGKAHTDYARYLNVSLGETGHFWQSRYFSCALDEHHQWEALRYVELNPVRAGLVATAEQWRWSSAATHLGGPDAANLLDLTEWRLRWCPEVWREVLSEGIEDTALLERIREATRTGRPAGTEAFVRRLEEQVGRRLRRNKPGPKPRGAAVGWQLNLEVE